MKEEDCNKMQIFYPKTKRCIKKDTKKAIEYLFNKGDKTIHMIYEKVDGKIVKRCEKGKIRNQATRKCIKERKSKNKSNSLDKKIDAIKRVKKALSPFINRVSADIYHRNKYLILMRRELKKYNTHKKGCLKVYKEYPNSILKSYRIGNRIILKKRIGSDSVFGIVYLSEFREKEKKMFTFASKVYEYVEKQAKMELEILEKLTNIVRKDICPHFPIFYGYVICENMNNFDKDSFKKSKEEDKSISQNILKFPMLIKQKINSKIITTFNELANGDLWNFLKLYKSNHLYIINALIQQLISIMFFNYHTGRLHNDTHPGNFLYHKIKAGGYFHYKLFGKDYYLENMGILWVIWDYDLSITPNKALELFNKSKVISNDYNKLLSNYMIVENMNDICLNLYDYNKFSIKNLKEYIYNLPNKLNKINNSLLLKKLPVGAKIINKNPYKIIREELFKNINLD